MASVDLFLETIKYSIMECQTRVKDLFTAGELNYAKQKAKKGIINVQTTDCISEGCFGEIKSYGQGVKQSKWSTIEGNGQFAMNKSLAFFTDKLPTLNEELYQRTKEYIATQSIRKMTNTVKSNQKVFFADIMSRMKTKHEKEQKVMQNRKKKREKIMKTKELISRKALRSAKQKCKTDRAKYTLAAKQIQLIKLMTTESNLDADIKYNIKQSLIISYTDENEQRHKKSTEELYAILNKYLVCKETNDWQVYDYCKMQRVLRTPFHQGPLRMVQHQRIDCCSECKQIGSIQYKCKDAKCVDPDCGKMCLSKHALCSECCKQYSKNGVKRKYNSIENSNDIPLEPPAKKQKLTYCFCAQPYDDTMIGCDVCEHGWFHPKCLKDRFGYSDAQMREIQKCSDWSCPLCNTNNK
eukprot:787086_1